MEQIKKYAIIGTPAITLYPLSILLIPLFCIPVNNAKEYRLPIKLKAILIPDFVRPWAEGILGNIIMFFSPINSTDPNYLYVSKKETSLLPSNLISFKSPKDAMEIDKTIVATFRVRKALEGGYLPAKHIKHEVVDEKPEWSK